MDKKIAVLADEVAALLADKKITVAVAESCTGGALCQALTDIPGSSAWFDRGFITYSNQAKVDMLGVSPALLEQYGAVRFAEDGDIERRAGHGLGCFDETQRE